MNKEDLALITYNSWYSINQTKLNGIFPNAIRTIWNANILVQDLNSDSRVLFHDYNRYFKRASNSWMSADVNRMVQGKRFDSNEEVISETEAHFESKDKSFNKEVSNC